MEPMPSANLTQRTAPSLAETRDGRTAHFQRRVLCCIAQLVQEQKELAAAQASGKKTQSQLKTSEAQRDVLSTKLAETQAELRRVQAELKALQKASAASSSSASAELAAARQEVGSLKKKLQTQTAEAEAMAVALADEKKVVATLKTDGDSLRSRLAEAQEQLKRLSSKARL